MAKKGNTGTENTGENNSGDWNSGDWNSGDWNSGDGNSGDRNSGDWNSGDRNSGDRNSGDWNSGYRNSGDWNSGYGNSGDGNSGDRNSGDGNSGDGNSGDWNSGDGSNGAFCLQEPKVRLFDKDSSYTLKEWRVTKYFQLLYEKFNLTRWISEDKMTDDEKKADPDFYVKGGYLKKFTNAEAWANLWADCDESEKKLIQEIPNFDAEIFKQISGIDVGSNGHKEELLKKANELIAKAQELKDEADKL